jgi:NAD-dependent deacetylase
MAVTALEIRMDPQLSTAIAAIRQALHLLVLTGAGISAESGVPTFRGGGGAPMWRGMPFEELSSKQMVESNLPLVWEWFDYRRSLVGACEPNAAHFALAEYQRSGRFKSFTLVTQNVDGLHTKAGSSNVIELHGNIWRARCFACGIKRDIADAANEQRPPICLACGSLMRPDVVLFGEFVPMNAFEQATKSARSCDVCLVVGTSSLVYPAAGLPELAQKSGAVLIEVNPEPTALTEAYDVSIRGKAGEVLPLLFDEP